MKIGMISEAPFLSTGFGVTGNQIAQSLAFAGHDISYFGIGAIGEIFDRSLYPYKIWTVGRNGDHLFSHLTEF
jgi:hypothetical protein